MTDWIPKHQRDGLLSIGVLKERGWTDGAVKRWLGEPDELRDNPVVRSSPPMRLWKAERADAVEATEEWQVWRDKNAATREARSLASRKTMVRKRKELADEIATMPVPLPHLTRKELTALAVDSYNVRQQWRCERDGYAYDYESASVHSDKAFLERQCVNHLRHEHSPYEEVLADLYGRVGRERGAYLVKVRVLAAIGEAFPYLKAECDRQAERARREQSELNRMRA